jgi:hypothetical protein
MTDASRRGQVITFYSFKGGVGRSMALANVAAIQAQRSRRVLVLDFDFEAPGLHRYFLTTGDARYEPRGPQEGMLNFFSALLDRLQERWPAGQGFREPDAQRQLASLVGEVFDAGDYLYHVQIGNPNAPDAAPARLDFVPAALFDETYPELVRGFDWQGFYDDYAEVFPVLAEVLARRYDYVLVDSRTGVADLGSICTMLLPDKLVLVFTPNEQSLRGALDAGWQAVKGRKELTASRTLPIFPLASRVEEGEHTLQGTWIGKARRGFERLFREAYGRESVELGTYFGAIRIPHRSFYAYGERIAAEDEPSTEAGSLAQAYHRFANWVDFADAETAQRAASPAISAAPAGRRFEVTLEMPEALSNAAALVQARPVALPCRVVTVSPQSPVRLEPKAIAALARQCQLFRAPGGDMFPPSDLSTAPERRPTGLLWTLDDLAAGYTLRFALGFDGSFAYCEGIRESHVRHPVWGTGVALFTCLDRVIGATLYARKLALRAVGYGSASLSFSLMGIENLPLAFDFDAFATAVSWAHKRPFVSHQDVLRVGGTLDPAIGDADVESFGAGVGAALAYYFGWDWQDAVAMQELRNIVTAAANRDPRI